MSFKIIHLFPRPRGLVSLSFIVGLAVTLFFGVMMFLLWQREAGLNYTVRQLGFSPDFLTATWVDEDNWMWIERGGNRIGAYNMSVRLHEPTGAFDLSARAIMQLNALNMDLPLRMNVAVKMSPRFEMETFQGVLEFGQQKLAAEAFVDDEQLFYRLTGPEPLIAAGGAASTVVLDSPVMLQDAIRPVVTQSGRLEVGNSWTTRASDPLSGRLNMVVSVEVVGRETMEIDGEPTEVYKVVETAEGTKITSWYNAEGDLLRADLGNGLELVRANRDDVISRFPSFRLPPGIPPLDSESIRAQAVASAEAADSADDPLFWLPDL